MGGQGSKSEKYLQAPTVAIETLLLLGRCKTHKTIEG